MRPADIEKANKLLQYVAKLNTHLALVSANIPISGLGDVVFPLPSGSSRISDGAIPLSQFDTGEFGFTVLEAAAELKGFVRERIRVRRKEAISDLVQLGVEMDAEIGRNF